MFARQPLTETTLKAMGDCGPVCLGHRAWGAGGAVPPCSAAPPARVASSPAVLFTLAVGEPNPGDQLDQREPPGDARLRARGGRPDWWLRNIHPEDRDGSSPRPTPSCSAGAAQATSTASGTATGVPVDPGRDAADPRRGAGHRGRRLVVGHHRAQAARGAAAARRRRWRRSGQLAGGVAHDFNNLLTVINGYSEMLLGALPERRPGAGPCVEEIREAGERAAGADPAAAGLQPQAGAAAAGCSTSNDRGRPTLEQHAPPADRRGRRARPSRSAPASGRVQADPGQIEQVLMNLAVNARDAMPHGRPADHRDRATSSWTRRTPARPRCGPGRYVLLAVSDTGAGMTPEVKARIFEPFFTTKEAGQGHGPGAGHGLRHRQAERRPHRGVQRGRARARRSRSTCRAPRRRRRAAADAGRPTPRPAGTRDGPAGRGRGRRAQAGAARCSSAHGYTRAGGGTRRRRRCGLAGRTPAADRPAGDRRGDAGDERAGAGRAAARPRTRG